MTGKRSDRKEEKGIKTIKREKSGVEKNKIMDRKKEGEEDKEEEPHLTLEQSTSRRGR
jgi:hypothetical protein